MEDKNIQNEYDYYDLVELKEITDKIKAGKTYSQAELKILYNKIKEDVNFDKILNELDEKISLSDNAQKFYLLYKKAKNEFEYAIKRYDEAVSKLNYYETILLNIDLAETFEEINQIEVELSEIGIMQNKIKTKKDTEKIKYEPIKFLDYEIFIGKNNKQNDYLISKIANAEDLWFHGLNFPSSHVILKVKDNEKNPPKEVLEYCARLVKDNSKAKYSGKTSIIMTKRKNLKKPPNTYLGYVTYKNETEIVI